jgi:hypothetical protein
MFVLEFWIFSEACFILGGMSSYYNSHWTLGLGQQCPWGSVQWKSYGRPTYVGALTLGYLVGPQPSR